MSSVSLALWQEEKHWQMDSTDPVDSFRSLTRVVMRECARLLDERDADSLGYLSLLLSTVGKDLDFVWVKVQAHTHVIKEGITVCV